MPNPASRPAGTNSASSSLAGRRRPSRSVPVFQAGQGAGLGPPAEIHRVDSSHPRVRLGPHAHRDLEILYFASAHGSHTVGPKQWPIRGGEIFLVPPGVPHDLTDMGDAVGWAVEFSPAALTSSSAGSLLLWRSNPLLSAFVVSETQSSASRVVVPDHRRQAWESLLLGMQGEAEARMPGHELTLSAYLSLVVVTVARLAGDFTGQLRLQDQPRLAEFFELVERRFREDLRLDDVARDLAMSGNYLTTLLTERTGRSFGQWITERRMAEARELLAGTDMPVQVVAARVGYDSPAYFSRRFTQVHGVPPRAWRRQVPF